MQSRYFRKDVSNAIVFHRFCGYKISTQKGHTRTTRLYNGGYHPSALQGVLYTFLILSILRIFKTKNENLMIEKHLNTFHM